MIFEIIPQVKKYLIVPIQITILLCLKAGPGGSLEICPDLPSEMTKDQ